MNRRVWALPINIVVFNLCRLIPFRNRRLWVYGAREGDKYDENAKYMFEYMNENHAGEIRSVWLTDNVEALRLIRSKGYESYLNKSWKGKLLQLRAGVALYCHGLLDFGTVPLIGGAEIVALWHGMGFKKIYNGKYSGGKLKLKKALDHLFSWTYRTLTPVTSDYAKNWANEMFTLRYEEIVITGQPRNDAFKKLSKETIFSSLGIDAKKRIIIYMPTYRMPQLGKDAMLKIVKELYDSKELGNALIKTGSILLVKLHPLTPHIDLPQRENFIILDYSAVESNQDLMGVCDVLVTDFSSCFVDYALLKKPILFYVPDEKEFLSHSESMEAEFFDICNLNKVVCPRQLADGIINPSLAVVEKTNEIFEDESIRGTCYSENIYNVISKKIDIS